jgi:hypothetical protein
MEDLAAGERIGAMTEVRGNPTLGHRTPAGDDLTAQVAVGNQAFEDAELSFAVFDLPGELIEHRREIRRGRDRSFDKTFGTTERRRGIEVEFALVEIGHFREPPTKGIEADHVCIHLPDARCQRIQALLQLALRGEDFLALRFERRAPFADVFDRVAGATELHTEKKRAAQQNGEARDDDRHRHRPAELELASFPQPLGKHDDVHALILVASTRKTAQHSSSGRWTSQHLPALVAYGWT